MIGCVTACGGAEHTPPVGAQDHASPDGQAPQYWLLQNPAFGAWHVPPVERQANTPPAEQLFQYVPLQSVELGGGVTIASPEKLIVWPFIGVDKLSVLFELSPVPETPVRIVAGASVPTALESASAKTLTLMVSPARIS
jgi:hypothetical protein